MFFLIDNLQPSLTKCQPLCIEYNLTWPGSILYQYVQGPLAGDLTEDFLAFLKNEFIRKQYIPKKYLLHNKYNDTTFC